MHLPRRRRSVAEYWEQARQHATSRLRQDFDIAQVTQEYRILRRVLTRRVVAAQRELDCLDDLVRMDEAIDIAIAEAVHRYSKARERLLAAELERLRLALQAGDLGMWDWLPKEGELTWDARTRALFDLPPGDRVSYERFLAALHPDDRNRVDTVLQERLRSDLGGDEYHLEFRVGEDRWVEARGRVLERDEQGYATRFIGTVLEITDRKRQERARGVGWPTGWPGAS